jgi:Tat protein secretion system quality control protein TatD with DNase activity
LPKENSTIGEIGIDLYWDKTHLKEQQMHLETDSISKKYKFQSSFIVEKLSMKYLRYWKKKIA